MGLLLLRATVGLALIVQGGALLAGGDPGRWESVLGAVAILTGASLLIGFLTPFAAFLAEIFCLGLALSWLPSSIPDVFSDAPATVFMVVMAAAVLLLGPGAFSLDARWFGRREIVIPPPSHLTSENLEIELRHRPPR